MSIPRKPDIECPDGTHLELVSTGDPPVTKWTCISDSTVAVTPGVAPPEQPEDYTQWPFPFNLAQQAIIDFFTWLKNVVEYGFNSFKDHFDKSLGGLEEYLSNVGNYLKGFIEEAQANINAFLEEKVGELGEGIKVVQKSIQDQLNELSSAIEKKVTELQEKAQEVIEERATATQTVVTDTVTGTQLALETGIKDTQTALGKGISSTQTAIETALDPETGLIPSLVKEVPRSILTFVGDLAAPFLKQLNATLEAT